MKYVYIAIALIFIIVMGLLEPTIAYTKEIIPMHNSVSYNWRYSTNFDDTELNSINITCKGHTTTLDSDNINEIIFNCKYKGENI